MTFTPCILKELSLMLSLSLALPSGKSTDSGQLTDDPNEMADIFVDSFASVFTTTTTVA